MRRGEKAIFRNSFRVVDHRSQAKMHEEASLVVVKTRPQTGHTIKIMMNREEVEETHTLTQIHVRARTHEHTYTKHIATHAQTCRTRIHTANTNTHTHAHTHNHTCKHPDTQRRGPLNTRACTTPAPWPPWRPVLNGRGGEGVGD